MAAVAEASNDKSAQGRWLLLVCVLALIVGLIHVAPNVAYIVDLGPRWQGIALTNA